MRTYLKDRWHGHRTESCSYVPEPMDCRAPVAGRMEYIETSFRAEIRHIGEFAGRVHCNRTGSPFPPLLFRGG